MGNIIYQFRKFCIAIRRLYQASVAAQAGNLLDDLKQLLLSILKMLSRYGGRAWGGNRQDSQLLLDFRILLQQHVNRHASIFADRSRLLSLRFIGLALINLIPQLSRNFAHSR